MPTSITEATSMTAYRAGSNADAGALSRIRGALPLPVFTAVGYSGTVSWSDNGAGGDFALSGTDNSVAIYTPRNKTQSVTITALSGAGSVNRALAVTGTLPLHPQLGGEFELDVETKVKYARDRTRYAREDGVPESAWVFAWSDRENADRAELVEFWQDHRKTTQFYLVDIEANLLNRVWFNSSLKAVPEGVNRWAMSAAFRGVYEAIAATEAEPLHLRINCGGWPIGLFAADQYYTNGVQWNYGAVAVDTTGLTDPAPDAVYQQVRYDDASVGYYISGLRPSGLYTVRMHLFSSGGARTVTPVVQAVSQSNIAIADGEAEIGQYTGVEADAVGGLALASNFVSGSNAVLSGIEVIEE